MSPSPNYVTNVPHLTLVSTIGTHDGDGDFIFLVVVVDDIIAAVTSASKLCEFYAQNCVCRV